MLKEIDQVKQGTDVILFIMDVKDSIEENIDLVKQFSSKHPILMIINKIDQGNQDKIKQIKEACLKIDKIKSVVEISALNKTNIDTLLHEIVTYLPAMPPYYDADTLTDKPMRFFVAELIREKLFFLLNEELPYHAAVIVRQYEEKNTLTKIVADIVVSRETQKLLLLEKREHD
ncbi:MAG: hypothetical protein IPN14_16210 [Bacteroidetes bacterium]|nr:hypothetical protein [Bacteroidota bacterium]